MHSLTFLQLLSFAVPFFGGLLLFNFSIKRILKAFRAENCQFPDPSEGDDPLNAIPVTNPN